MKLTKINILAMKKGTKNKLDRYVLNYILNRWNEYENKKSIFTDVLCHGCQSGVVGELCYYSQTILFYNKYKNEIKALLYDVFECLDTYSLIDVFGDAYNKNDPLCLEDDNQNILAWFGFEETLNKVAREFEVL